LNDTQSAPGAADAADGRTEFVEAMLERYRALTLERLLAQLPDKEPRRYLYDLIPLYPQRPSKGLRPALCIATCAAFGGSVERVLQSAVAIELFHNAFLVHDDIEDGSKSRRGRPTLYAEHGLAIALNVGDAMNVLSIRPLMDNLATLGPELTWRIFGEIEHMVRQSVEGQAMELGWVREGVCGLDEQDYLRMILKKTCWYTCIHPCRIGALVATAGAIDVERFNRFGYYMGAAFQIQDDILNLVADGLRYGKEIDGDIWEGKRTLMLIHAYNHANTREQRKLQRFLAAPRARRKAADVAWVHETMERHGSIAHAQTCARHLAGAALREYGLLYGELPDSDDKRFVESVVLYMIERAF
jgi:geranylgeranyl diphosphate synthase, type II